MIDPNIKTNFISRYGTGFYVQSVIVCSSCLK